MNENKVLITEESPDYPVPPADDYDPEEERKRREAEMLAPYKAAARLRNESAAIIAEHDDLLAELLYESSIRDLEEV